MQVAIYVRVSTTRQSQTQTIEQPMSRLQVENERHSDWDLLPEHVFRDDGISGATLNRPGLDRLRDVAAFARYGLVLVTDPDRLGRKYVHQVLLVEEFDQRGCQVHFLERPMKADDPHDQLLLQIRGAVAEYERNLIAERMRRGRQAKLRAGTHLPWTTPPYGYLVNPERPRDPSGVQSNPVKAEIIKQNFAWYTDPKQSVSLSRIAKQLSDQGIPTPRGGKRWNVATIRGLLRSTTNSRYRLQRSHTSYTGKATPFYFTSSGFR